MATINPAKVINRAPKLGTLQIGAPADVAIMLGNRTEDMCQYQIDM